MFTANGRVHGSGKEKASKTILNKEFRCTSCGALRRVGKVEFGEKIECLKCGSPMAEREE